MGLLFIPWVIYEDGEPWWNDSDRGNPKNLEKKPITVPLCPPQIAHGTDPGVNMGLCSERPASYHLSHGMTMAYVYKCICVLSDVSFSF
jgi:hypothetical protein